MVGHGVRLRLAQAHARPRTTPAMVSRSYARMHALGAAHEQNHDADAPAISRPCSASQRSSAARMASFGADTTTQPHRDAWILPTCGTCAWP